MMCRQIFVTMLVVNLVIVVGWIARSINRSSYSSFVRKVNGLPFYLSLGMFTNRQVCCLLYVHLMMFLTEYIG